MSAADATVEHRPLLRGEGRFVDDVGPRGALEVAFVRSPWPHARIASIETGRARQASGVAAVVAGEEFARAIAPIRAEMAPNGSDLYRATDWHPMAPETVRYTGEIVAVTAARNRYLAEDAAALVDVEYEPRPAAADVRSAHADDAPLVHAHAPANVLFRTERSFGGEEGRERFDQAPIRVRFTCRHPRVAGMSMEGCGAVAVWDRANGTLEFFSSTQTPHLLRDGLARSLGFAASRIRVVAPDVGGGFGPKMQLFPEEVVTAALAIRLARPVKWVQDRMEHLQAAFHSRDVTVEVEAAAESDGRLAGLRARALCDVGAYSAWPLTCSLDPQTVGVALPGPYRVPYYRYTGLAVATHKFPTGAYRGVGFPLGPLVAEEVLARVARAAGLDPVEVRRRNLLCPEELPHHSAGGAVYDSGDYPELLARALERAPYTGWREEQERREGRAGEGAKRRPGARIPGAYRELAAGDPAARTGGPSNLPGPGGRPRDGGQRVPGPEVESGILEDTARRFDREGGPPPDSIVGPESAPSGGAGASPTAGEEVRRRLGIGMACFVESTGMNRAVYRNRGMAQVPAFDSAVLRIDPGGGVEAFVSTPSQGQSQPASFRRLAGRALGVPEDAIRIVLGDTAVTPYGSGTFASRAMVSGGGALLRAAAKMREKLCRVAAARWEVDAAEVRFVVRDGAGGVEPIGQAENSTAGGAIRAGVPGAPREVAGADGGSMAAPRLEIVELARLAHAPFLVLPADVEPGLEVHAAYDPPGVPVSCAAHLALVEVDPRTGAARVLRYVVAEDCGPIVNPAAVDGQIRGAVAQGIGCALLESIDYDEAGQHRSASLMDYLVPAAADVPDIDIVHMETPSPFTEGGIKGMGESGTIGAPAAVVNAVLDALGAEPAEIVLPLTPERIVALAAGDRRPE